MITSRELALKILYQIDVNNAYSNLELNKQLNQYDIPQNDKAFVTEIVYGVIKWKLNIDYIIKQFSKLRLKKISPWVLNILRIGIYQMKFLDKVPDFAAVNESVKLAKKYSNEGGTKFINGLLRNYIRNENTIKYPDRSNLVQYLSIIYSHPEWLVEKWIKEFGCEFTESLLKSNNEVPNITIRVNTLKCTKENLIEILNIDEVDVLPGHYLDNCLVIKPQKGISSIQAFKDGLFQIQDESSIITSEVLNPRSGSTVIDVCAAPGGKSTHIAQLMGNIGKVICRDIHEHKIKLINDSANRLGIDIIKSETFDATELDSTLIENADYVLVDAPCSGLGIIRRKPDIKWNREIEDTRELIKIQKKIIEVSSKYVKIGGYLVYSTCTIENEENIDVIIEFLKNNSNFELVDISDIISKNLTCDTIKDGYIQIYPNIHKIDGFFVAKMVKK